jgi:beta-N-acetylhexosaminidase
MKSSTLRFSTLGFRLEGLFVRTTYLLIAIVAGVFFLETGCAPSREITGIKEVPPKDDWVEKTLKRLTLDEKVAQMVVPKVYGNFTNFQSEEWKRLVYLVKERKVGGIAMFAGNVTETAFTINQLQELADVPLLVSADFERGLAMRTRRATAFPDAMALAATRDPGLAYQMGKIVAEEARAFGVHQNFAPVADVNVHPENPVINIRSYGEDPQWVAEIASAYARGLQDGGVLATAKHFPGHGDVNVDSHIGLPVLNVTAGRLDSTELVPFRRLIDAGVKSIMMGHIAVPSLDSTNLPATLSPKLTTELLLHRLGYQGLIVADALEMFGVLGSFTLDEASIRAVEAGIDVLLAPTPGSETTVIDAVKNAVFSGRIPQERINRSVGKILAAKKSLGLDEERLTDVSRVHEVIGAPLHWETAKTIARASVTVLKNEYVLPLQRIGLKNKIALVVVADHDDYRTEVHRSAPLLTNERAGTYFATQLRRRYANVELSRLDPRSNAMEVDSILTRVRAADVVVCPVYVKARSGSGKFGLPQQVIDWTNTLALQGKPTIFIAMASPYILDTLLNGSAYLCTYSDGELSTEAVVEALFGEIPVRGKLPITLPRMFPLSSGLNLPASTLREESPIAVGFDSSKLTVLDSTVQQAIGDSAFPGAQLLVAKDGAIVYNKAFGTLEYSSASQPVNKLTMYDIASLTKVVATTSAVLKLSEEGKLRLEDTVARYLPEFGKQSKEKITIRHLLLHTSGLPAFKKLFLTTTTAKDALDSVYNSELIYKPGDSTVYSDFGFIVLGKIVEKVSGMTLDRYVTQTLFLPLEMSRTMFNPPESLWSNIAPTELDTAWRKVLLRGIVHDETASLLGGVAGHAGLFSTASDLAVFVQMMMNAGFYGGRNYLTPESFRLVTARQDTKSTRTIGWDTKTPVGYSSAGTLFSYMSFGHTGFTGTSIWVDPERNLFVIFLTNRVHPTRENTKIFNVRPAVHDAVVRALK